MEAVILLLIIAILIVRSIMQEEDNNWINKAQRKNENRFNYLNQNIIHDKSEAQPKWYPTGWYYNEESKSWEPPDYIKKEATDKWRWDEERQIWIDKEKEKRLERYYAYRKSQGLPPTYEEWKSAKLAEERKKQEADFAPANTRTEQGTYRYDYYHVPDDQQETYQTETAESANQHPEE